MKKVGIIGGGNMGEAIIAGIHKKYSVRVCEQNSARGNSLRRKYKLSIQNIPELIRSSEIVVLAVKPQDFEAILHALAPLVNRRQLIISIAAGITSAYIEKVLGKNIRVIRTMPNMPALIGQGLTAICRGRYVRRQDVSAAVRLFECVGTTVVVPESRIDAITAVSGSGPAYVFFFAECLMKAARKLGFKEPLAKQLIEHTLSGSVNLLRGSADSAEILRKKVTSKGGTTQAALDVLMKNKFEQSIATALQAAQRRAKQLARK